MAAETVNDDAFPPFGKLRQFAPGIKKAEEIWTDRYVGSGDDLVAAGVIGLHQLPGQPGNGRFMQSFLPGGQRIPKGMNGHPHEAGYMVVQRYGEKFMVNVVIAKDEGEMRNARHDRQCALRRSACFRDDQVSAKLPRGHLRLVWSAPA